MMMMMIVGHWMRNRRTGAPHCVSVWGECNRLEHQRLSAVKSAHFDWKGQVGSPVQLRQGKQRTLSFIAVWLRSDLYAETFYCDSHRLHYRRVCFCRRPYLYVHTARPMLSRVSLRLFVCPSVRHVCVLYRNV